MISGMDALFWPAYPTHVLRRYNVRSIAVTTAPTDPVVDIATVKQHLRVDTADNDTAIQAYLAAAVAHVESATGVALTSRKVRVTFDRFAGVLYLPAFPLVSVDAVGYLDTAAVAQTLANTAYRVDPASRPARLTPIGDWPRIADQTAAVTVDCSIGYATPPPALVAAVLLLTGDLYANREATGSAAQLADNPTVNRLLFPYRSMEL